MKTLSIIALSALCITSIVRCVDNDHRYVDLETGKRIDVVKDADKGYMVNADTKVHVIIQVDTKSNDNIYGKTGKVINDHVIKTEDGKYKYVAAEDIDVNADGSYKVKDGDYKKKVEADGDVKIKDGDTKVKIDGETGEEKVKKD